MTKFLAEGYVGKALLGALLITSVVVGSRAWELHLDKSYDGARSPYIQLCSTDSMVIRWETSEAVRGKVYFGRDPERLDQSVEERFASAEHRIEIGGLVAGETYYYSVGSKAGCIYEGDDYSFQMPEFAKRNTTSRFWVLGDPGKRGVDQEAVRDAACAWMSDNARPDAPDFDLVLTLGDNAYTSGSNQQFQDNFFEPYKETFRATPVIPAYGNHDSRRDVFFNIFDFPAKGELGGHPSGTTHYFSINFQDIHLVYVDSTSRDIDERTAMFRWLTNDLAINSRPWTIVVLHHPPYSSGSHSSDDREDSDGRMGWIRKNLVPVMERGGVDLVLSGHSHGYERSKMIDGHYGTSDTLEPVMLISDLENSVSVHAKPAVLSAPNSGTIYVVAGSSSKVGEGAYDHPIMHFSKASLGSLVIDVGVNKLISRFIGANGDVIDEFCMEKSVVISELNEHDSAVH